MVDKKVVIGISSFIILFISLILIGISVETIQFNEIAIVYNHFYETLDNDKIYSSQTGRFFIGVNNNFLKFPKFYESVEFSDEVIKTDINELIPDSPALNCTTKDGLGVKLELNFYFTLNPLKLKEIYLNFGLDWRNIIIKASLESIKNTSTQLNNIIFFEDRKILANRIRDNLQSDFNKLLVEAFKIEIIQLRDIVFNKELEESLNKKLIQKHNKKLFELNGQIFNIEATINLIIAQAESKIKDINAKSIGNGIEHNETELSKSLESYFKNLNQVYFNLKNSLGFVNNDNLYKFIYSMELNTYDLNNNNLIFLPPKTTKYRYVGINSIQKPDNSTDINLKDSINLENSVET